MPDRFQAFAGRIYKVGIIRCVDVPAAVSNALRREQSDLPVCGTVEGVPVQTRLVSRGNGCPRMAIHGDIRRKLRVDAGAVVEIALERDEESREPVLPPALIVALRQSPRAQAVFKNMTTALLQANCEQCGVGEESGSAGAPGGEGRDPVGADAGQQIHEAGKSKARQKEYVNSNENVLFCRISDVLAERGAAAELCAVLY
jgi:hypothetical protein